MEKQVYTVGEVKEMLGVGWSVVYRELRLGNIPNKKIGGKYRIPKVLFDNWLTEQTA